MKIFAIIFFPGGGRCKGNIFHLNLNPEVSVRMQLSIVICFVLVLFYLKCEILLEETIQRKVI